MVLGLRRSSACHCITTATASTDRARDEHESTGATGTSTRATATETVSQLSSIHAGRPRCQLGWGFATAFENGLAELCTTGWTSVRSAYGDALARATFGHGRGGWWTMTRTRGAVTASAEIGIQGVKLEEKECVHAIFLFLAFVLFFARRFVGTDLL